MISTRQIHTIQSKRSSGLPASILTTVWSNLPILLFMDAVFIIAAAPAAVVFFTGGSLFAPLVAAFTLGPVWAGVVASTDRMIRDEAVSVQEFFRNVKRNAWRGVYVSSVPAVVAIAALGTLSILDYTDKNWLYIPLFVDGSILVLVFVAGFSIFSLATTGGLRGWVLWRFSLELAATRPFAALGTISLSVLLGFLVIVVPGMLPLLPAPFAVYLSALTWSAIEQESGGAS